MVQAINKYLNPKKSAEYYLTPCSQQALVQRYVRFLAELYSNMDKPQQHEKASKAVEILSKKAR
jgi:hypothetical protein